MVRLYLSWFSRSPALGWSPVLMRLAAGAFPLLLVGLGLVITALALGPYTIPLLHTVDILLDQIGIGEASAPQTEQAIVASVRMPRVALTLVVGSALGVAGAVMQGLFRNPMADPGIIGVSAGGALGAIIAISTGAQVAFALALPAMSFAGAGGTLALVYGVASVGGRFSMSALLLSGVAIGAPLFLPSSCLPRTWKRSGTCCSGSPAAWTPRDGARCAWRSHLLCSAWQLRCSCPGT